MILGYITRGKPWAQLVVLVQRAETRTKTINKKHKVGVRESTGVQELVLPEQFTVNTGLSLEHMAPWALLSMAPNPQISPSTREGNCWGVTSNSELDSFNFLAPNPLYIMLMESTFPMLWKGLWKDVCQYHMELTLWTLSHHSISLWFLFLQNRGWCLK